MPQIDFDGANSLVKTDKIQGQGGTTVTVPTSHTLAITDADRLTIAGTAVKAGALGKVLQVVNTQTGAVATGTTVMPEDDTIPQNTEGVEFMTLAITPTSASSKLLIQVHAMTSHSDGTANTIGIALFQDSTANALGAMHIRLTASLRKLLSFNHYMTAGTTSATTFKVRIGGSDAGTTTFNGNGGSRLLGGAMASSITITEIAV